MSNFSETQDILNETPSMTVVEAEPVSEPSTGDIICLPATQEVPGDLSLEDLAQRIQHCHEQAEEPLNRWLELAHEAGRYLICVKNMLEHGEFGPWVRENCPFDERQAQRYMRLVRKWPAIKTKTTSEVAFPTSIEGLLEYVCRSFKALDLESKVSSSGQHYVMEFKKVAAGKGEKHQDLVIQDISSHQLELLRQQIDEALAEDEPDASDIQEVADAV